MPLTSQDISETADVGDGPVNVFEAEISNVRTIILLLKAIQFDEMADVYLNAGGVKVTVEQAKCIQGKSFLQADLFSSFTLRQDNISFRINLNMLLECLSIFGYSNNPGINPTLKMCYAGYGSPLTLLLVEHEVCTECSIKTFDAEDLILFDILNANVVNMVIMKSDYLKDTFAELDTSSEYMQLQISPQPPHFRISTIGSYNNFHLECPKDSDVIEHFQCTRPQTNKYNTLLMKPSTKALTASSKVCIKTDDVGLLYFQFLILVESGLECFVEFYCAPNVDAD